MKAVASITLFSIAIATSVYAGNKAVAPEKSHGLTPVVVHQNALEQQIPSMQGYELRGRMITLSPGAATGEHSHAERPGIVYVIKGTVMEYRNGEKRQYSAGDTWLEAADTVHWVANPTDETAKIFMVDLPEQK